MCVIAQEAFHWAASYRTAGQQPPNSTGRALASQKCFIIHVKWSVAVPGPVFQCITRQVAVIQILLQAGAMTRISSFGYGTELQSCEPNAALHHAGDDFPGGGGCLYLRHRGAAVQCRHYRGNAPPAGIGKTDYCGGRQDVARRSDRRTAGAKHGDPDKAKQRAGHFRIRGAGRFHEPPCGRTRARRGRSCVFSPGQQMAKAGAHGDNPLNPTTEFRAGDPARHLRPRVAPWRPPGLRGQATSFRIILEEIAMQAMRARRALIPGMLAIAVSVLAACGRETSRPQPRRRK